MSSLPAPILHLSSTATSWRSRFDVAIRQAIITYDGERVAKWDVQAEAYNLAFLLKRALNGQDYGRERGIVSIRLVPEGSEIIVAPALDYGKNNPEA